MKNFKKAQVVAKNLPTGSYASGCPVKNAGSEYGTGGPAATGCKNCERTK